jgi:hypothetical protein
MPCSLRKSIKFLTHMRNEAVLHGIRLVKRGGFAWDSPGEKRRFRMGFALLDWRVCQSPSLLPSESFTGNAPSMRPHAAVPGSARHPSESPIRVPFRVGQGTAPIRVLKPSSCSAAHRLQEAHVPQQRQQPRTCIGAATAAAAAAAAASSLQSSRHRLYQQQQQQQLYLASALEQQHLEEQTVPPQIRLGQCWGCV